MNRSAQPVSTARRALHWRALAPRWPAALAAVLLALACLGARAEHIVLEPYQEGEGLGNLAPQCLVQDRRAMLWICTENGLFRFDGFKVRPEPLPSEAGGYLYGGHVDPLGRLWVLAEGGVYLRRQEAGGPRWTALLKPDGKHLHVQSGQQFQVDGRGTLYAMDEDRLLWTAPAGGPLDERLTVQRVALPAEASEPDQLPPLRLRGASLWLGCGLRLCEWRGGRLQAFGPGQGLPADRWGHLLVARDGSLWARSDGRLAHLAPGAARFEVVAAPPRQNLFGTDATVEDPAGGILTTTDRGMARWDGRQWREWTAEDGLPDARIGVLAFDAEGSLWLGASGRGVYRWVGYGQVEHWTRGAGLTSSVAVDVARDGSGRLWLATREGVAWFDAVARRFRLPQPLVPDAGVVYRLAVDGAGDLWWVDKGRLLTVKAGSTQPRLVLREAGLTNVLQGVGRVYVNGGEGPERLVVAGGRVRCEPVSRGIFDPRYDAEVVRDGRQERFFTDGRNLWQRREGAWSKVHDAQGREIDALQAAATADTLWASGTDGLARYTLTEAAPRRQQFLPKAAFGGAMAAFLVPGADGRLWMGTDQGLFIRTTAGAWARLDRYTGLVWNDLNGFFADRDGGAWVATSAGLTHLLPPVRPAPVPALRLDAVAFGSGVLDAPPSQPVAWEDRSLRVTLGTAGFSRARSLRIEYRLDAGAPWREAQGSVIDVGAIEAGAHVLELRAAGMAPVEEVGPVLRMAFEVRPPWWNSDAARLACAAALAALWWFSTWALRRRDRLRRAALEVAVTERTVALASSQEALHRLGEHNARALEDERKRVSRELHDELGQQLAALRMEVSVAKARVATGKPVEPSQLDLLLGRVDRLVSTVRGLVSQLRPPALDGGLAAALEWLATEFSGNTGLPCTVQVDPQARLLPPDIATMVFRVAQESLNNVRRHAQASTTSIRLTCEAGQWVLEVRDDGVGFDPAQRRTGYGLPGMEERARLLGGTQEVHSAPGEGTTSVLRFAAPAEAAGSLT